MSLISHYHEKLQHVGVQTVLNEIREKFWILQGVDFAGPVYLKENQKGWICLFTCAVYRTVHLELVTSLSTDAFLEVLRRFIACARNYLCRVNWNKIKKYSSVQKIEGCFNPPSAAWWERL
ncbi:hypothetical protein ILUMI_02830, partial [Ignelater luminosus]